MTHRDARQKTMLFGKNNDVHAPVVLASIRRRTCSREHIRILRENKEFCSSDACTHVR